MTENKPTFSMAEQPNFALAAIVSLTIKKALFNTTKHSLWLNPWDKRCTQSLGEDYVEMSIRELRTRWSVELKPFIPEGFVDVR